MANILSISAPAFWVAFTGCLVWYVTSARSHATMTYDYLKALWHNARKIPVVVAENGYLFLVKTEKIPV
jgi:hypothetical protein